MAVTGFLHHVGTILLFVATILLIVTTISAPVVKNIAIMKINLGNATSGHYTSVVFGTFGHCILDTAAGNDDANIDFCTRSQVGYAPADVMTDTEGIAFSDYARDTTRTLTKVMILHPIATGIVFIAFLLSLGAGVVGSLLSAMVALLAFLVVVVVLVTDFVLFSIIRSNVNDGNQGSEAFYSTAMWTLLAAAVCTLFGTVVVFFTCCSARLHDRRTRGHGVKHDPAYVSPPATRRRRRFF